MDAPIGRRFAGAPASMGAGSGDYQQNHSHPPPPPPQNQQQGHYWYPPPSSTAPPGKNQHFFPHNLQQQQQQHLPALPMASGQFPPHPPPQYPHHQQQLRPPPWIPPSDHLQQFHQPSAFPPGVSPPLGMHFSGPHAAVGSPLHHGAPPPNPPYPTNRPIYPPHPTQSPYSQSNQMAGNPSWHGTQGWNYTDPNFQFNNGEDWGARAREWAAANSSTEVISSFGPPNNVYNDQYQNSKISSAEEHLSDSRVYPHGRLSNFQEPSHSSTSFDAGDGATATRSVASSTPVNVQEVPSSYSSFSGNREATDTSEKLHVSIPGWLPVPSDSPHLREHSVEFIANTEQTRVLSQSAHLSSVHGYAQAAGPVHVPLFPHVTPVRPAPQFEPPSISSSLPGQPQVFGRIQQPNFQVHLGFDVGSHPAATFHVDSAEAFNLSERPKKAAVPNWLKDEIIKKKASIVGSTQEQPNVNSHLVVAQVHGKDSQKGDPRKIIDSPRSMEDEEDDEDDADAARLAAINQEIKRVLTDVLLKVTDELFEEIATKVLNEDEPEVFNVAADHKTVVIKHRDSTSPPSVTPKTPANVFLRSAPDGAAGEGGISSTGGAILGLADYSSSDDDDGGGVKSEGIEGANLPSSDKVPETSEHHVTADSSSEGQGKREKGPSIASEELTEVSSVIDGSIISHVGENKLRFTKSLESGERGNYSARKDLEREKSHVESDLASGHSNNGKSMIRDDDPVDKKTLSHKNFVEVHEPTVSRRGSKDSRYDVDDRKSSAKDRRDRPRDDDGRKREKTKDEKEERFRPAVKDLHKQKTQHVSQPSARIMVSGRESSFDSASASGDEEMESSRKRKLRSRRESLSPSPTRSRRHVLRSPHSKHSQRRHSPYSHSDSRRRRSRSRSSSPGQRRRSGHRR